MADSYMKQYIELSKEFKTNNQSNEAIEKLCVFALSLEESNDEKSKVTLLPRIYTLLGISKKENNEDDGFVCYAINKKRIICGQTFGDRGLGELLEIKLYKDMQLPNYISRIYAALNWLAGDRKDELIQYYNRNKKAVKKADNEWYEGLDIFHVLIQIIETGEMTVSISCTDYRAGDHFLVIDVEDERIIGMSYNG